MKIYLNSIFVNDQKQAVEFYTNILGFIKKNDIPLGKYSWLTVVAPDDKNGTELLLEPNSNEDAKKYQKAMFKQGIPITSFSVSNINEEFNRPQKT